MATLYSNKKKNRRILPWIFVLVVFVLVASFLARIIQPLSQNVLGGFFKKSHLIKNTLSTDPYTRTKKSLLNEIESLKKQNEELVLYSSNGDQIRKENEELRAIFGRVGQPVHRVVADIVAKPNQSAYDTLLVHVDENNLVEKGMIVLSEPETILGVVDSKSKNNVIIDLFSKSGTETIGRLERNNQDITLIGRGGSNFIVEVPTELEVQAGDRVVYPSFNNVVLGVVKSISNDDRNPKKILYVTSFVNPLELARVYIVTN